MSISKLTANVSVHQSMEDEPNDVGGLTAAELKAAWDAPANAIKDYVNDSLIPELDAAHLPYQYGTEGGQTVKQAVEQAVMGTVPDGSVTTVKLADGAVTAGKIASSAIATQEQAAAGEDNSAVMTPLRVRQAGEGIAPWRLLQSYTAAGTCTWTAPDLYGDGKPYEIGVRLIGGGQSGEAVLYKSASWALLYAFGGGSGVIRSLLLTATPGASYPVAVGAGGAAASVAKTAGSSGDYCYSSMNSGGTSAFAGNTAEGGGTGGTYERIGDSSTWALTGKGVGGQSGDHAYRYVCITGETARKAPCCGEPALTSSYGGSADRCVRQSLNSPMDFFNPFDPAQRIGSAGGAAGYYSNAAYPQKTRPLSDGGSAGEGKVCYATALPAALTVSGNGATSPGSGGGGCAVYVYVDEGSLPVTAASGAGADGGVWIYARRYEA